REGGTFLRVDCPPKSDWTFLGPGLASQRGSKASCDDYRHLTTNQINCERGQPIVLALGRAMFDDDVLTFDVASFLQPFCEPCRILGENRCVIKKSNGRYGRLLRTRHQRPCHCRAANQRNELAPPHCSPEAHVRTT